MTPHPQSPKFTPPPIGLPATPNADQRPSRLLTGIYHDIGMAAVALGLELEVATLEPPVHDAVRRGARYICLMPKRQEAPVRQASG
jgi:hypothetical protein